MTHHVSGRKLNRPTAHRKLMLRTMVTDFMGDEWKEFERVNEKIMSREVETKIPISKLEHIAKVVSSLPQEKNFLRKIIKLIDDRKKMFFDTQVVETICRKNY